MKTVFAFAASLALLVAVARADYLLMTQYSDAACTMSTGANLQYAACAQQSSTASMQVSCSAAGLVTYSASTTCASGSASTTNTFTQLGFTLGTCAAAPGGSSGFIKNTCVAGAATIAALAPTSIVMAYYADTACTKLNIASSQNSCSAITGGGPYASSNTGCTITSIYQNLYTSATCSDTPAAGQASSGITLGSCIPDPLNSYGSMQNVCGNPVPMVPMPAMTSGIVVKHYTGPGCKGTSDGTNNIPMTWGRCVGAGSSGGSSIFTCKNGVPSVASYSDASCKTSTGPTTTPACMPDTAPATGSAAYSCIGGTTSGAAAVAAGVIATVAAAAAIVALA